MGEQWQLAVYVNSGDAQITAFGIGVSVRTSIALTDAVCMKLASVSCRDQYATSCWPSGDFVCSVLPLQDSYGVTVQKASNAQGKGRVRVATLAGTASEATSDVAVAGVLNALHVSGGEVAVDQDAFAVRGRARRLGRPAPGRGGREARAPAGTGPLCATCAAVPGLDLADSDVCRAIAVRDSVTVRRGRALGAPCAPAIASVGQAATQGLVLVFSSDDGVTIGVHGLTTSARPYDSGRAAVHFIGFFPEIGSVSAEWPTLNNIAASDACSGHFGGAAPGLSRASPHPRAGQRGDRDRRRRAAAGVPAGGVLRFGVGDHPGLSRRGRLGQHGHGRSGRLLRGRRHQRRRGDQDHHPDRPGHVASQEHLMSGRATATEEAQSCEVS